MIKYILFAIVIIIFLCWLRWWTGDSRKRNKIRKVFKKGARCVREVVDAANTLHQLTEPKLADHVMIAATLRDVGHEEQTARHNDLILAVFQAGLTLPFDAAQQDDDIETIYMLHQIIDAGAVTTPYYADRVDKIHTADMAARVEAAKKDSSTRAEATIKFLDESQGYTNAPQNVHDSAVSGDLRGILAVVSEENEVPTPNMGARAALKEAYDAVNALPDDTKRAKALATLAKISENETCSTFGMQREADIFSLIWSRADHPANKTNRGLIREAVVCALVDSVEETPTFDPTKRPPLLCKPVCINGRIGRVINSLALLDFDPRISSVMTYEAYRNQILEETKGIFEAVLGEFEEGDDVQKAAFSAFEEGKDTDAAPLLAELQKRIDSHLLQYSGKITALELEKVRKECNAYLAM